MAKYEVVLRRTVLNDIDPLPSKDVRRIMTAIHLLADNPRPPSAVKLSGREQYRLREGAYRILYEIADRQLIVCVVKVWHRRDMYR